MADPVAATEVRRRFSHVLRRVAAGERVTIESYGRPVAVVVPVADAETLDALERFVAGRGLHADVGADEDWTPIFGDIAPFEL